MIASGLWIVSPGIRMSCAKDNCPVNPGKLPLEVLTELLRDVEVSDPRVALGPQPGEDAALIDFGDRYLVAKTDPITFATDLIGWYMVNVNANDLAVMGATPKWLLATLLLPGGTTKAEVSTIFQQLRDACAQLRITLVGGHTEVTYGLDRPIAVGAMLGEVEKDRAVLSSGVQPGDALVLTKGIAIEGSSILAREAREELLTRGLSVEDLERAGNMLFEPGISVIRDAQMVCAATDVHAMHDPTEGGLSGGLYELGAASGIGFEIDSGSIPVLPECRVICESLGLDPLGLIASGSLLAAVNPSDADHVLNTLAGAGIQAQVVGYAADRGTGVAMRSSTGSTEFPRFDRDELARFFDQVSVE